MPGPRGTARFSLSVKLLDLALLGVEVTHRLVEHLFQGVALVLELARVGGLLAQLVLAAGEVVHAIAAGCCAPCRAWRSPGPGPSRSARAGRAGGSPVLELLPGWFPARSAEESRAATAAWISVCSRLTTGDCWWRKISGMEDQAVGDPDPPASSESSGTATSTVVMAGSSVAGLANQLLFGSPEFGGGGSGAAAQEDAGCGRRRRAPAR